MHCAIVSHNTYLIRLEKGEKLNESVKKFCDSNSITNAFFWAIGSVENPTVAHYRVDTKKYTEKILEGIFEITNLTGTVGQFENSAIVHSHVTLSDDSMQAFGGHLVDTVVSATLEVGLKKLDTEYQKVYNEEIGLKLFDLPNTL